jgi:hypothetical protein
VATDGRGPWVSGLGVWPSWQATWRRVGWAAPGLKEVAGRLGWLAAQERKTPFLINLLLSSI